MIQKLKERMEWERLHHLYIGIFGGSVCLAGVGIALAYRSLTVVGYLLGGAILLLSWAFDDLLYHLKGWKTPCWWIEQFLRKFGWWRKLEDFLNRLIGGHQHEEADKIS